MNEQLRALYASRWENTSRSLQEIVNNNDKPHPTNPLLLYVDKEEEWLHAGLRVMIFGQESNDWEAYPGKSIDHLLGVYDDFFNKGACWGYGGQFWNAVARFQHLLDAAHPTTQIRYMWNNIVKIGKIGKAGFPPGYIYNEEYVHFHVIPEEVAILKPHVALFLTGPNYDGAIDDNFGRVNYTAIPPYTGRQLARLSIPGINAAFRTYHSPSLWRNDIQSCFEAIIKEIAL
ncbi:MAG: hypothetical protein LBS05_06015 [Tannerellaceae bacterium]|nr:hypothetical protein [Tannerellaceae bacterium]